MLHPNGNKFPIKNMKLKITCKDEWNKLFAEALHKEMQLNNRNIESIANWARVNKRTVKCWLEKSCSPNSFSLIQLMLHSEYVRQLVWKGSGMQENHMAELFFMDITEFLKPWMTHLSDK